MVKIIDVNGNPIDTGKMRDSQTAKLGWMNQTFAGHPSRGLTPSKLAKIMEAAEQGDIQAQHELFLDMEEKDGHIFAEMSKRKRALLTVDWDIVPPRNPSAKERKAAAYIKELLQDLQNFEDTIQDASDAIGHGFACLEIQWQMLGQEWLPKSITHRPQSWFQTDRATRTELRYRDGTLDGAQLWPFGWITHVHKAKSGYLSRAGLHRVLAWPFLFKNFSVRDLAEFLEIYGLPLRLGTYPSGSSDAEKATLLNAVAKIGHDAAGIIPEGMLIDFKEAAKGASDPFEFMVEWCERTQSKVILGGTLTSQADGKTSTNALGNVHNEVRHDLMMSDARQLAGTLTRDLVYPLYALNVGGIEDIRRCPRLVFDLGESEDMALYADALPKLASAGVKIPVSWAREKLRIPEPDGDEPVLTASQQPAPLDPQPDATTRLAKASADLEDQDEFDVFADELSGDWERLTDPMVSPILELAARSTNFEEFQAGLAGLIQSMSPELLGETLAQAQFAANIYGRVQDQLKEDE
jgi:phage gp29-like protein